MDDTNILIKKLAVDIIGTTSIIGLCHIFWITPKDNNICILRPICMIGSIFGISMYYMNKYKKYN
jgi:hypothetical protein